MPPPHPSEFRRRPVGLARESATPIARVAADIGISESCRRRLYRHFGFHDLDGGRLWRRLADIERALS